MKGSATLVGNLAGGAINSVSSIVGAAGEGLDSFALTKHLGVGFLVNTLHKSLDLAARSARTPNTKGYSSTYLAMGFANIRAGTWYPPEH